MSGCGLTLPLGSIQGFSAAASRPATMKENDPNITDWVRLIRAEYLEIPDLCLTKRQAQVLWGLDDVTAETILEVLTDVGFLRRTGQHAYVRADAG
jgi:hypothetical protein